MSKNIVRIAASQIKLADIFELLKSKLMSMAIGAPQNEVSVMIVTNRKNTTQSNIIENSANGINHLTQTPSLIITGFGLAAIYLLSYYNDKDIMDKVNNLRAGSRLNGKAAQLLNKHKEGCLRTMSRWFLSGIGFGIIFAAEANSSIQEQNKIVGLVLLAASFIGLISNTIETSKFRSDVLSFKEIFTKPDSQKNLSRSSITVSSNREYEVFE